MLYVDNLNKIIFHRHELFNCDELVILSGYVGPSPVQELNKLPVDAKVIYGMYGCDGIGSKLHFALCDLNTRLQNVEIKYSTIPVHSKCYIWRKNKEIVHALIGSANFSTNGLNTPFKEVLAETTADTFSPLNDYLSKIWDESISCNELSLETIKTKARTSNILNPEIHFDENICKMILYDPRTGEVPTASGLNWGHATNSHVSICDAYIPIRAEHIQYYPSFFPKKQEFPTIKDVGGRASRHNDAIEMIWDDGYTMKGLLEGSVSKNGIVYPKQISSFPHKKELGEYIRKRMGLSPDALITRQMLKAYGRDDIDVTLQGEGIYSFDFSV